MRLVCNINGSPFSLFVNTDKPLNRILEEEISTFPSNSRCLGSSCGNCVVLIDGVANLSCLLPAFKLNGTNIITFEGFRKTRFCHDIERAYSELGMAPCPTCYASKTLIIGSILTKAEKAESTSAQIPFSGSGGITQLTKVQNEHAAKHRSAIGRVSRDLIESEIAISTCKCMELSELEKIVNLAYQIRSKRSVRRS